MLFLSIEGAEKTEENIQASDNTHEENKKLLNAAHSATGKSYSCMLKISTRISLIYIYIYNEAKIHNYFQILRNMIQ